jgi:hypothetical protein
MVFYFMIDAGHFYLPKFGSFNPNGIILIASIAVLALSLYLILYTGRKELVGEQGKPGKYLDQGD